MPAGQIKRKREKGKGERPPTAQRERQYYRVAKKFRQKNKQDGTGRPHTGREKLRQQDGNIYNRKKRQQDRNG